MTAPSAPTKTCPLCGLMSPVSANFCANCSHEFQATFNEPPPVQMYQSPVPPPYQHQPQPTLYPAPHRQHQPPPYHQSPYQQMQQQYRPADYDRPRHAPSECIQLPPGAHQTAMAVMCAILMTGGGQMYNKQVAKGATLLAGAIFLFLPSWGLLTLAITVTCIVDAVLIANRLNRGEVVGKWQFF